MNMLEQLENNVKDDAALFAQTGTSYRKVTSSLAEDLLHRLLRDNQFDVLQFTQVEFQTYARSLLAINDERAMDVGKFLFVHKQKLVDEQRFAHRYKKVDELLQ